MALFKITVKQTRHVNGIQLEKGMSVEVVSRYSNPVSTNGGKEVVEAFQRKYGIDIKKAASLSSAYLQVDKV
ncbi:MAG: hypothetical protein H6584_06310 [Flavobacteriales bacterium]|nr:hypothetical protein [Flavobacteriales bacterium]